MQRPRIGGVDPSQPPGMKGRPSKPPQSGLNRSGAGLEAIFAIEGIADQGVADTLQMNANLVRPSGRDLKLEQAHSLSRRPALPPGERRTAVASDGHLFATFRVSTDGGINGAGAAFRRTIGQGQVTFLDLSTRKRP